MKREGSYVLNARACPHSRQRVQNSFDGHAMIRCLGMSLIFALGGSFAASAQEPPSARQNTEQSLPTTEEAIQNPQAPCVQPEPMVRWQDYKGPFAKTVGVFAQRLDRKSVHPPRYKPGVLLCSLSTSAKFVLFLEDSVDAASFMGAAFNAGLDQAEDTDPTFGQGAAGYGKRFGAELANNASGAFFGDFLYPSIFSEDPRYYRLAHGPTRRRLFHAMEHVVVGHQENGAYMFNFSEWLGATSAVALANTYHPDNRRGIGPAAKNVSFDIATDMGYDVLREFWPEIARKFKLPFRGQNEPQN